jgi:hypothetical protein
MGFWQEAFDQLVCQLDTETTNLVNVVEIDITKIFTFSMAFHLRLLQFVEYSQEFHLSFLSIV